MQARRERGEARCLGPWACWTTCLGATGRSKRSLALEAARCKPAAVSAFHRVCTKDVPVCAAATAGTYSAKEVLACLWKLVVPEPLRHFVIENGQFKIRVIPDIKKLDACYQDIHVKAELLLYLFGDQARLRELAFRLQERAVEKVRDMAKLPNDRRQALMNDAARTAEALLDGLGALHELLAKEGRLQRLPGTLPQLLQAFRNASPDSGLEEAHAAGSKGSAHEVAVAEWARKHLLRPGQCLLEGCHLVSSSGCCDVIPGGVKAEFDGLLVDQEGCVSAVFEAKAGCDFYADLPKAAEAVSRFFGAGSLVSVRVGRSGDVQQLKVGEQPPRLVYVFGASGSFEDIVLSSAMPVEAGFSLQRELASNGPSAMELQDGGAVRVRFSPAVVAASERRLEAFREVLLRLLRQEALELWVATQEAG